MKFVLSLFFISVTLFSSGCSKLPQSHPRPVEAFSISQTLAEPSKRPRSFAEAKRAASKIFEEHPISFYCGCHFDASGEIDARSCSYRPTVLNRRTFRIEWEHIVPAKTLGEDLLCWHDKICVDPRGKAYKGRACCAGKDAVFRMREADLHNLVPAIGLLNQARGTLPFGELPVVAPNFMGCHFKIDRKRGIVEPDPSTRGIIARAYLYMRDTYGIHLSQAEQSQYAKWHRQYPPQHWEIKWNESIKAIQGNSNPYID